MPPADEFQLLFLEDIEQEQERFFENIEEFNKQSDIIFRHTAARTASEAIRFLDIHRFDCAILDLRVPSDGAEETHEDQGNKTLQEVVSRYALPVIVHSAFSGDLDDNFLNLPLEVIDKEADSHQKALKWLADHAPLMAAIRESRMRIQVETASIFFKAIWPRWEKEAGSTLAGEALHDVISRQIVSYISEKLSLPGSGLDGHHLHEFYFVPPLREERLYTGDLINHEGNVYVIVTPQCNIARTDPDHFLLAKCKDISEEWTDCRRKIADNDGQPNSKVKGKVQNWATQNVDISEHFLPPCDNRGPWLVDFKTVISVPKADAENLTANRFASITPQFISNLIQRWASYMGRVGQPDLNRSELIAHIVSE